MSAKRVSRVCDRLSTANGSSLRGTFVRREEIVAELKRRGRELHRVRPGVWIAIPITAPPRTS